jgi:hypothetical protein
MEEKLKDFFDVFMTLKALHLPPEEILTFLATLS